MRFSGPQRWSTRSASHNTLRAPSAMASRDMPWEPTWHMMEVRKACSSKTPRMACTDEDDAESDRNGTPNLEVLVAVLKAAMSPGPTRGFTRSPTVLEEGSGSRASAARILSTSATVLALMCTPARRAKSMSARLLQGLSNTTLCGAQPHRSACFTSLREAASSPKPARTIECSTNASGQLLMAKQCRQSAPNTAKALFNEATEAASASRSYSTHTSGTVWRAGRIRSKVVPAVSSQGEKCWRSTSLTTSGVRGSQKAPVRGGPSSASSRASFISSEGGKALANCRGRPQLRAKRVMLAITIMSSLSILSIAAANFLAFPKAPRASTTMSAPRAMRSTVSPLLSDSFTGCPSMTARFTSGTASRRCSSFMSSKPSCLSRGHSCPSASAGTNTQKDTMEQTPPGIFSEPSPRSQGSSCRTCIHGEP
mmetsp:Transcript_5565/g.7682  ORF Transcript_5565/g.7682 Transcript_5565/m.7682 type:complete len:425 (+) Transcript_5565:911-2185(+)